MPERTLTQWIEYTNSLGLHVTNMCQMHDGKWRVNIQVFGATPALARDLVFVGYADRETPEDCFAAIFKEALTPLGRMAWQEPAALALAAMADKSCCSTLILADRPAVNAARAALLACKRAERTIATYFELPNDAAGRVVAEAFAGLRRSGAGAVSGPSTPGSSFKFDRNKSSVKADATTSRSADTPKDVSQDDAEARRAARRAKLLG